MKEYKLTNNQKTIIYTIIFGIISTIILGMYDLIGGGGQFNRHYTNIFYSLTLISYTLPGYFIIKNYGIKISYLIYLNLLGIILITIIGIYITYWVRM